MKEFFIILFISTFTTFNLSAQNDEIASTLKALGAPNNPKVDVSWNRFYDYENFTKILKNLNLAYPNISRLGSIGKSYEGRDIWCMTITNLNNGNDTDKPGFFIDANIHANEIQAVEVALYTAWYLLENYSSNEFIKKLVDTKTFYIIPSQSPDSREKFFYEAVNANYPRSGQIPRDDDTDGLFDEDKPDDINNDGHITQMRVKITGGRWRISKDDPRLMERCSPDEEGEYEVFFTEGIDNDGDGEINEDGYGYYDPNRNWGWLWRPHYIQYGADRFPFNLNETKAISDFIKSKPNILASQSYHNSGGMILRGPGTSEDKVEREDEILFDMVGKKGEKILPGYNYWITHKDLYTVWGGETDWHYAGMGIMPFVNELWTSYNMFRKKDNEQIDAYTFDKLLLFGEAFLDWQEVDHPDFGKVEVGGFKKQFRRVPPSFLLEEECHRNMAFTFYHASLMPEIEIRDLKKESLGNGIYQITAAIVNSATLPTRLKVDVNNNINKPDIVTIEGIEVLAGGVKESFFDKDFKEQKHNPHKLRIESIQGNSAVIVTWIVKGEGKFTVKVDSPKGGKKQIKL